MLKNRLIPIIVLKGEQVVQSLGFKRYLPIGNVKMAIEFFVNWDVDEISIIDIDATKEGRGPRQDIVCLLYTSPSPRDLSTSRMPSSA